MEGDLSRTKLLVLDSDGWKSTIKQNVKALQIKFFNMIEMVKERYKFAKHLFVIKTCLINTGASEYVNYHALTQ